jgi:diguanylate cyclase (GGDEF)-like protein
MIKPPIPIDELLRLETLRRLNILDTDAEERFDRVTRLARRVFGTPIALVSLVDAERQWFKSSQGLEATETHRDISFCGHAVADGRMLIVSDTLEDERFSDNPLVTCDPNIRFYAGYPLSAPDGRKVGTLCVIDREPREVTPEDIKLLEELGHMVEEELVIANMLREDPVTGLSNRDGFSLIAKHLLAMCARTESPASLILFRLTREKASHDSIEPAEFDRATIELAQLLMANFRDSDVVGRIGVELFAVLLTGAQLDDEGKARQRLLERVEHRNRQCDSGYKLEVESYAIAYHPERHPDVEALLQDAESGIDELWEWESVDSSIRTGTANSA